MTDDVAAWQKILAAPQHVDDGKPVAPIDLNRVVQEGMYLEALLAAPLNWGNWEIHHANPPPDPQRYRDTPGVLMTHSINRMYTAASPRTFEAFRAPAGLAVVRHYALNEQMMFDGSDQPKLGYFVADIERAGPYSMMTEAMAVANGDPTMIGYLVGNNFGRGFPQYVRSFNAAFLALPALPSRIVPEACEDGEVVVRAIATEGHGTWYAMVNTGWTDKHGVQIRLPGAINVQDAATGEAIPVHETAVVLDFYPCQLRALHAD